MLLPRWNPVGEMVTYQDEMDPVFEHQLARALNNWPEPVEIDLPIHFDERGDRLVLYVDLTGVKLEGLKASLSGYTLKIKGEFETRRENESNGISRKEPEARKFVRYVELPAAIQPAQVDTRIRGHFLVVSVPTGAPRN